MYPVCWWYPHLFGETIHLLVFVHLRDLFNIILVSPSALLIAIFGFNLSHSRNLYLFFQLHVLHIFLVRQYRFCVDRDILPGDLPAVHNHHLIGRHTQFLWKVLCCASIIQFKLIQLTNESPGLLQSLSFSTAFCYAWHYIMRSELQYKELNFISGFSDSVTQNDFKFGVLMMILDTLIYTLIGYFYEKFRYGEYKHDVRLSIS